jgi:DNA-binding MarR family transcriptional regulator
MEQLAKQFSDLEDRVVSCCGLTFVQFNVITEIGRAGSVSLNKLAESTGVDKSTMSITVSKLVKLGLAGRELDALDRRYVSIVLTEEGKKAFEAIQNGKEAYYSELYASIPENMNIQVIDSITILNNILMQDKNCNC